MQRGKASRSDAPRANFTEKRGKDLRKVKKSVPISKRIRDVKRLMNKPDLPAAIKAAQEKKLAALEEEMQSLKRVAMERKLSKRYHHVRFFERVKIDRELGKLQRRQRKGPPLTAEDEARVQQLVEDLDYVIHFPKGEKYVALLKSADTPKAQAVVDAERARLRALVRQQLAEAALVGEADEGRSLAAVEAPKRGAKRTAAAAAAGNESGEEAAVGVEKDDFFLFEDGSDADEAGSGSEEGDGSSGEEEGTSEGSASDMDRSDGEEDGQEEDAAGAPSSSEEEKEQQQRRRGFAKKETDLYALQQANNAATRNDRPPPRFGAEKGGSGRGGGRGQERGPGGRGGGKFLGAQQQQQQQPQRSRGLKPPPQSKPAPKKEAPKSVEKAPLRKRAEGGRKRR